MFLPAKTNMRPLIKGQAVWLLTLCGQAVGRCEAPPIAEQLLAAHRVKSGVVPHARVAWPNSLETDFHSPLPNVITVWKQKLIVRNRGEK